MFDNNEDSLWDALAINAKDIKLMAIKNTVKRRLQKVAALPIKSGPTPWEQENADVIEWLKAYKGDFSFYLSVRSQYEKRGELSEKQVESIRKAIQRDTEKATSKPMIVKEFSIKAGQSLMLTKFWANKIGKEAGLNRAHFLVEVVDVIAETQKAYQLTIKMSSKRTSHCSVCGRTLTDAYSVTNGVGPICAKKYGVGNAEDLNTKLQLVSTNVTTWLPKMAIKQVV